MNKEFRFYRDGRMKYSSQFNEFYAFFEAYCSNEDESQQWTGALDKNSRQIYEGDIVLWNNPDPYDSQDNLTMIVGYNSRSMGYKLYNFPEDVGQKAGRHFFPEEVEVIGNIFEGAAKDGVDYGLYLKAK